MGSAAQKRSGNHFGLGLLRVPTASEEPEKWTMSIPTFPKSAVRQTTSSMSFGRGMVCTPTDALRYFETEYEARLFLAGIEDATLGETGNLSAADA